jgi:outer membrane murein-binding lipoprotein Lpp
MKTFSTVLLVAAVVAGCQNDSKLDGAGGGGGNLEARVKKLEESNLKYAEALAFLEKVYAQQKQQQQQQQESEPDPNAMFAVDITPNIQGGLVEGPATGANVTIVEAWDFA